MDADIPLPLWGQSDTAHERANALAVSGALTGTHHVIAIGETKATETAEILAQSLAHSIAPSEAQTRIVRKIEVARATVGGDGRLFVGHGGYGPLRLCHLSG
jgi:hypothetical protein